MMVEFHLMHTITMAKEVVIVVAAPDDSILVDTITWMTWTSIRYSSCVVSSFWR